MLPIARFSPGSMRTASATIASLALVIWGLGCAAEKPPDVVVDSLYYQIWPEDPSIEIFCMARINQDTGGEDPPDPNEHWNFKIHGWVDYGPRVRKSQSVNLNGSQPVEISFCFDIAGDVADLAGATYGFEWSGDSDPPYQANATIYS